MLKKILERGVSGRERRRTGIVEEKRDLSVRDLRLV